MDETKLKEIIASAIANARGARHGVPNIANVLTVLPEKLKKEVYDDADSIINELKKNGVIK